MARISILVLIVATLTVVCFGRSSSQEVEEDVPNVPSACQWSQNVSEVIKRSDYGKATIGDRAVRWHFSRGFSRWKMGSRWSGSITDVQTGLTGTAKKKDRTDAITWAVRDLADKLRQRGLLR